MIQQVEAMREQAAYDLAECIHGLYGREIYQNWHIRDFGPARGLGEIQQSIQLVEPAKYREWYRSLQRLDTSRLINAKGRLVALYRYSIHNEPKDDRAIITLYLEPPGKWVIVETLKACVLDYPNYEEAMASGQARLDPNYRNSGSSAR